MTINDFNMFIIDSNNWQEQEPLFFGYKTTDFGGFWLKITKEENKLIITGSYLQPVIAIYRQKDYWAISNSPYLLANYLQKQHYLLTPNSKCCLKRLNAYNTASGYAALGYDEFSTPWTEIVFKKNFSYLEVQNNNLLEIDLPNTLCTKSIFNNKALLFKWWNDYKEYIDNIELPEQYLTADLSGGIDSRTLMPLWMNKQISRVNNRWQNHVNEIYDGIIGRLLIQRYSLQNQISPINKNLKTEQINAETVKSFWHGIKWYDEQEINHINVKLINQLHLRYTISGIGTEPYKEPFTNQTETILGNIRRFFIPNCMFKYYIQNRITIAPFLDERLLQLQGLPEKTFMYILTALFGLYDSDIPYFSNNSWYFITPDTINKIREKMKNS